jgi:hypothetical protein
MTPWSTEAALQQDGTIRVTAMLSTDPGPAREFRPLLDIDLDEAHATELLGKLELALQDLRESRTRRDDRRKRALGDPGAVLDEIEPAIVSVSEAALRMRFALTDSETDRALLQSVMLEQGWVSLSTDFGGTGPSVTWWRRGAGIPAA